jgi:hypothetical protein
MKSLFSQCLRWTSLIILPFKTSLEVIGGPPRRPWSKISDVGFMTFVKTGDLEKVRLESGVCILVAACLRNTYFVSTLCLVVPLCADLKEDVIQMNCMKNIGLQELKITIANCASETKNEFPDLFF